MQNVKVGGVDIDPDATYTLAGHNDLLLDFGDGYNMFEGATVVLQSVAIDNQVLIDYITDELGGNVSADSIYSDPYGEGRIKIFGECDMTVTPSETDLTAVSYTHLDVYKRQVQE